MKIKSIFASIVAFIAVIILLAVVFGSSYTVDQGERAVQLRNGKVTGVADAGFHLKMPFIEDYAKISTRQTKLTFTDLEAYSYDQQPATMRVSVTWAVNGEYAKEVYSEYGSAALLQGRVVEPLTFDTVKNVFGKFTAINAIQNREKLGQDIAATLRVRIANVPSVTLVGVQIEEVGFSNAYEDSIEKRMTAEVNIQTRRQNLETEKINAAIAETQATGRANSALAEAKAQAQAIELRGNAEAKAIEARAKALAANTNLVNLNAIDKWDGKLPVTMVPGSATPFVNIR